MSETSTPRLTDYELRAYRQRGWTGPFPLLGQSAIRGIVREHDTLRDRLPWYKGHHVFQGPIVEALSSPEVVGRVSSIMGDDLLLWGSQVMAKRGGRQHRWHVDVETIAWTSVNFWAALENVSARATVLLLPETHRLAHTPQDLELSAGLDVTDSEAVRRAALERGIDAKIHVVDIPPGHFVLFDGHLWHGSINQTWRRRTALLAQYSPTDQKPRIPRTYTTPIQWAPDPAPCLLVSGEDRSGGHNHYVAPQRPPRVRPPLFGARRAVRAVLSRAGVGR